jgi:hypothetical protein
VFARVVEYCLAQCFQGQLFDINPIGKLDPSSSIVMSFPR